MDDKRKVRKQKAKERQDTLVMKILGGVLAVAALVTAVLAFNVVRDIIRSNDVFQLPGVSIQNTQQADNGQPAPDSSSPIISADNLPEWDGSSRINILILGLDYADWSADREGPARSDTMMVLTIDPVSKTAGMLSIPRDMWVNVPGFGQNKINTAYFLGEAYDLPEGGPGLATQTVEEFLGVDIQYYAQIDFSAFVQFVDYIGGLKVEVKEDVRLEFIGNDKIVKLKPGTYTLNGEYALAYARNRSAGNRGDFGRARRQQQLVLALRNQLMRSEIQRLILSNPQGMWDMLSSGIQTNIPFDDAFKLGVLAMDVKPENIKQYVISKTMAATGTSPDGLSILIPIPSKIRQIRDAMFTQQLLTKPAANTGDLASLVQQEAAAIGVYNGSLTNGLAGSTQEYLLSIGLNVIESGNRDQVPATSIYDYTGNPYTIQYLVQLMNIQSVRIFNAFDPNSPIDVAVVVGNDWQIPSQ